MIKYKELSINLFGDQTVLANTLMMLSVNQHMAAAYAKTKSVRFETIITLFDFYKQIVEKYSVQTFLFSGFPEIEEGGVEFSMDLDNDFVQDYETLHKDADTANAIRLLRLYEAMTDGLNARANGAVCDNKNK